jgi:hypothetical protein
MRRRELCFFWAWAALALPFCSHRQPLAAGHRKSVDCVGFERAVGRHGRIHTLRTYRSLSPATRSSRCADMFDRRDADPRLCAIGEVEAYRVLQAAG